MLAGGMEESWKQISARMAGENPVFIVGVPRSGTTALRHTLDQLPAFLAREDHSPETRVFATPERLRRLRERKGKPAYKYMLKDAAEADALLERMAQIQLGFPRLRRSIRHLLERRAGGDRAKAAAWRLAGNHHLLRLYFHHAKRARGCSRLLEKSPRHVFFLNEIFCTFPRAQTLMCVRHPVDVYSSYRKRLERDRRAGKEEKAIRWLSAEAEDFARRYARIVEIMLRRARERPEQCMLVRYEELTANTAVALEGICRFLDEHFDEKILIEERSVSRDDFGSPEPRWRIVDNRKSWEDFLGREEANRVEEILAGSMSLLGYPRYTQE
jgi:hypothetical protein